MSAPENTSTFLTDAQEVDRLMEETEELLKSPEADVAAQDKALLQKPQKPKMGFLKSFARDFVTCLLPFGHIVMTIRNAKETTERINNKIARDKAEERLIPFQQKLLTQYSMVVDAQQKLIGHLQKRDSLREEEIAYLNSKIGLLTTYSERLKVVIAKLPSESTTKES